MQIIWQKEVGITHLLSMLINYFNLDSIKPIINYSTIELRTTYIMKAGHTLAVFLLWMGSLHTISSVDMTSNGSKKPDHGQSRGNEWEVRRIEMSVPLYNLTLTSDGEDCGSSMNRNTAGQSGNKGSTTSNQSAGCKRKDGAWFEASQTSAPGETSAR